MNTNFYVHRVNRDTFIPVKREVFGVEQVEHYGRIVTKSTVIVDDPVERLRPYSVLDFCLENLVATGKELKSCKLDLGSFVSPSACLISNVKSHE